MPKWTEEQRQAIDGRNCNLLVSAAAGSGKTAVLVQRILDLVMIDGVDIDRMLVVTFTNAAASEMKERIAREMLKASRDYPDKRIELRRQLSLLNRSYIMTMHSFCLKVLRSHFHLINLDPLFRVGKETEITLLKQEALDKTLENFYEKENPAFYKLIECFCDMKSDIWLETNLSKIYYFIQSQPHPIQWLQEQVEQFEADHSSLMKSKWIKELYHILYIRLTGMVYQMERAQSISLEPDGPYVYEPLIEEEISRLKEMADMCSNQDINIFDVIQTFEFKRLPAAKNVDKELKELAQELRTSVKKEITVLKREWFEGGADQWAEDLQKMKEPMEVFRELLEEFHWRFSDIKREKNIVDFNDLEHMALDILSYPEASQYYSERFQYIFIDEYQDSNRVQEALTDRIRREFNVFMVGDVKQSIYRFRLAEPALFIKKQHSFSKDKLALNRRIDLNRNFRSRKEVLTGVNTIFKKIMSTHLGEMEYTDDSMLLSGGVYPEEEAENPIEIHIMDKTKNQDENDQDVFDDWTDQELEAKVTAKRIKESINGFIYDETLSRKKQVQYRDIVILMRSTRPYQQIYEDVLSAEGIPVFTDTGTGFFETIEVQVFINLLKIVDNSRQDIPLLSVLRSPIGGFEVEELSALRLLDKNAPFYKSVEYAYQTHLCPKTVHFVEKIAHWRENLDIGLSEWIWQIMNESGYYAFVASMPGGEQRQANLRILAKRAEEFEVHQEGSLYGFLQYVEKLKGRKGNDFGVAKLIGPNNNVVRIMSIHKSKGLEFPVVILAGAGRGFNLRDTHEKLLVHKDLGLGPICAEPDKRVYRSTIARNIIKEKIRQESLSEEMRILYVAMTRAKEKLMIIGSVKDPFSKWDKWENALHPHQLLRGQSYLDWIGPVLASENELAGEEKGFENIQWLLKIWHKTDLAEIQEDQDNEQKTLKEALRLYPESLPQKDFSYVKRRLEWEYPYIEETNTQTKYSVSDLVSEIRGEHQSSLQSQYPSLIKKPLFLSNDKQISGAEKGTLLHYVIQQIDFRRYEKDKAVMPQLNSMVEKSMISREECSNIEAAQIEIFLESPLGIRMRNSEKCQREWPFVYEKEREHGKTLIQGMIDCFFYEEESIVLVDYKSDVVLNQNLEQLKDKYRIQMNLYQEALETLTKHQVKEKWIYSFFLNKMIPL